MENEIQESGTPEIPPVDPAIPDVTVPTRAPRRRGRGRTTLLIAAALVLGAVAGTVTGYAVQYQRPPTALPPLAQQKLDTPKALAPDDATTAKSINANRWHKTDGDLTELLIEAPAGAKVEESGYDTLDSFATRFDRSDAALRSFAKDGFRRAATTLWMTDDVLVEVRLVQFRDFSGANGYQKSQSAYMDNKEYAGNDGVAIPGVPADLGHVWVASEIREKPGYLPIREGRALVRRGDIVLDLFYVDRRGRRFAESDVIDLAKRQLERL
ncbi:hypothetical protein [Streptomyces sp. C]|uniref:hypothetical protein n=1 Tax=Streptomyces sp. C TaxID=253839 RepID=UPI0001DEF09A|nr:hypothetical protein [Streptomyces sp. C]EFL16539.1 conserved hypothetical protein [Streptomyces sp. C]